MTQKKEIEDAIAAKIKATTEEIKGLGSRLEELEKKGANLTLMEKYEVKKIQEEVWEKLEQLEEFVDNKMSGYNR
jgi:chromosome segregation ATPase